jgi:UDP-N-acetylmuramoylalanine--D-glutamate ligase
MVMRAATRKKEAFSPGPVLEVKGRRALVVGAARTGVETANFLARRGAVVTITDIKVEESLKWVSKRLDAGVRCEFGGHRSETFLSQDLIVPSPGVPKDSPLLVAAPAQGIPVMSEIELAYRFLPASLVAVTGTNGKSTVVTALTSVLEAAGIPARTGGNIGNPLIGEVDHLEGARYVVAEVSSFQLEGVDTFRPRIAAILNVTEDHLDRYPSFDDYVEVKARIFANQKPEDYLVLNGDDPILNSVAHRSSGRVVRFSRRQMPRFGVYLFRGWIHSKLGRGAGRRVMPVADMRISGEHNWENAMAVTAISLLAGASPEHVREVFREFRGLPHRTEFVREAAGVKYFDDSKGTNVGATARTIAGFREPLVLIAGGRDKGGSYAPLAPLLRTGVKRLVAIGEARERMAAELDGTTSISMVAGMEEAVREASRFTEPGDVVLLSPACSSFDQYGDYGERGRHFQEEVWKL